MIASVSAKALAELTPELDQQPIGVAVLGSTGSIGISTLDVLRHHPQRFRVVALTANRDCKGLYQQCLAWQPQYAVMNDANAAQQLHERLRAANYPTQVLSGQEGLEQVATMPQTHYVMAAIVGSAGLLPTLAATQAGKRVLLANKESLVMAGNIFMDEVRRSNAELLPIDSEHNALFQCMPKDFKVGRKAVGVTRILLTGSGGPFRELPMERLAEVTPEQACAHPNWSMGQKISVDSATLMNKGLEVIEAHWLFGAALEQIQVIIHPQSIVHSLVEYADGSLLAQLSNPDMRTPIAHALAWPQRMASGVSLLDLLSAKRLDFEAPDVDRFPCLRLAFAALAKGGTAPAILNAANEAAVQAFLERRIGFTDIARVNEYALESVVVQEASSVPVIIDSDLQARQVAKEQVAKLAWRRQS